MFKGKKGNLWKGIILIALFFVGLVFFIIGYTNKLNSENPMCEDVKASSGKEYVCCQDCHKLNMAYLRYEFQGSLFGANTENCYCATQSKIVQQIW